MSKKTVSEIGIVGLGRMGKGLAHQWLTKGIRVVGYNRSPEVLQEYAKKYKNFVPAYTIEELVKKLKSPRVIWMMLSKSSVDNILFGRKGISENLKSGDLVIDGGNSYYEESIRRAKKLARRGIRFMDVGVSGGPSGARNGACLMVGGKKGDFKKLESIFRAVSLPEGVKHFEGHGAGHFVKMVHNGIEYGMMQAIAEGFDLMKNSKYKLNLLDVTHIYQHGSVVESRLVGWLGSALKQFGRDLKSVSSVVGHTGEGEWTVLTAKKMKIPVKVISESFKFRVKSAKNPSFAGKVLTAMRNQFGQHNIKGEKRDS